MRSVGASNTELDALLPRPGPLQEGSPARFFVIVLVKLFAGILYSVFIHVNIGRREILENVALNFENVHGKTLLQICTELLTQEVDRVKHRLATKHDEQITLQLDVSES